MKKYTYHVCNNVGEVQAATTYLDVAEIGNITYNDNIKVDRFRGVYNTSKKQFCNIVGSSYHLIQHKQYFDIVADALQRLNIPFNMKITQQGHKAFADIEFQNKDIKFEKLNEKFSVGFRLTNSYNKSVGLSISPMYKRLACMNGMVLASFGKSFSIRHNQKAAIQIERFVEISINKIIESDNKLQVWVSQCLEESVEWNNIILLIKKLFSSTKHQKELFSRLGIIVNKIKDKTTGQINITYQKEDENRKYNKWDIYNAITNYLTHGEHISPLINEFYHKKAESILTQPISKLIEINN
jgi:hypothetical protein